MYRFYASIKISDTLSGQKQSLQTHFINLQYTASCEETLSYCLGICVSFVTLRFIKLLRFNKRVIVFVAAFRQSLNELFFFGILFLIFWMSFVQAFYVILNNEASGFSTFLSSMETCFQIILGKFNADTFYKSRTFLAPILFVIYNVVIVFTMITVFIALLGDHFESARNDKSLDKQDPELIAYLISFVRPFMFWKKEATSEPTYVEDIETWPNRFDEFMDRFQKVNNFFNFE